MSGASAIHRGVTGATLVLAALGPVGAVVVLMFGEMPLWHAPAGGPRPPGASAGIVLGTWPTLAGLGLLVAAPFRLVAAAGMRRGRRWGWPALALATGIGCLDLSAGLIMVPAVALLWRREGPVALFADGAPKP